MEIEYLFFVQVGYVLYYELGLFGVLGLFFDLCELIVCEVDNLCVQVVFVFYVCWIVCEIGALVVVFGGLDCLVFMVGIGEYNVVVCECVVSVFGYLGVYLDDEVNQVYVLIIFSLVSWICVVVEFINEEWVVVWYVVQCNLCL